MSEPLVSIVTPTLNAGTRLERCIHSIERQTYPHIEHVIIDGGSTDGTLDLLSQADVTWVSEPDGGQADAINKGFRLGRGDVLGWLNADDLLSGHAVERVVAAFSADPSVGWTYGRVRLVSSEGAEVDRPDRVDRPLRWSAGNLAAQPGSFFARWALDKVGLLDESYHYMMDLELWLRLIDADIKAVYIPEVLATFEIHDSSKSGSVPHSEFIKEEARARLRSGRVRSGAVAIGRVAAWRQFEAKDVENSLVEEIGRAMTIADNERVAVPLDLVRAAASAEALILRVKMDRWRALGGLLDVSVWRYPETRYRIMKVAGRELRRVAARTVLKARPS